MQAISLGMIDSLAGEVERLKQRLVPLEQENSRMKAALKGVQADLNERTRESDIYRTRLQHILWITGMLMFLLLIASFFYLLRYSFGTRRLLRSVQTRLKTVRKELRSQRKAIGDIPATGNKRIRKIASREVKSRMRKLKVRK